MLSFEQEKNNHDQQNQYVFSGLTEFSTMASRQCGSRNAGRQYGTRPLSPKDAVIYSGPRGDWAKEIHCGL